ncbi:MAG: bifunctional (p)ppGpp synthetase/guanosine-3',5'-bis(diphosphate) 3'-pyrophosphohydrolase [Xylanivirga thermophila]|jgi:GTP diphosphokinase / guanosine-3',5'-bis(diphosphate) 3'-diphosphatase|uniref:RelA/SpoT family protein n=1 Tax=Xylanivirga thermophila TaxID=2496273 RepID=UPI00101B94AE|nr:bifunctional (p)ppGpp synthetase/guanosine-3',5'-bis(diphosphate) 3'-pyrophosphohydrolase [Xylanivirga thermophila]
MLEELKSRAMQIYNEENVDKIIKAYTFAEKAHTGQTRSSGEPYIVHPVQVAHILMDLRLDADTVAAGLLHDVIEDTGVTLEELTDEFGPEIAKLVDGVTKLGRIEYKTKEEQQAESLRKMFLAMARDIRVIIIKLADRLHNLRTLEYVNEEKQREKAYETLEIYAPLAHRLGISKIKWELEDISLRYIDPKGYYDLVDKVAKKRKEREQDIDEIITTLQEKLNEMKIDAEIAGRPKHFYSIYKKMYMQHKDFEQIYDLLAIRVIVNTVKDCYGVLGIVHTLWKPIPGRFKDYIAVPKPNMYQSLHTTVIGPRGEIFEIQIRTWEMHRTAEYGIAAHWKYKEGRRSNDDLDNKLAWLRELMEWQSDLKDPKDFMETLKIDLFADEVFVFTPKGDVIDLPKGSVPLDFAYDIHSDIGNKCVGAKVNGKLVTLDYKLQTGDIIEILTSSNSHGPSRDWLKIVKTNQAKNKIKQWFKKERREENIIKGKEMLERECKRQGYVLSDLMNSEWLEPILKKYGFHGIDDIYSAIGYGGITTNQILSRLIEEYKKTKPNEPAVLETKAAKVEKPITSSDKGVRVKGIDNVLVRFAKCCNPVPGDDIVGYITRGRGISIHRSDCINLKDDSLEDHRLIEVSWVDQNKASYSAKIQIIAIDRQSLLTDITRAISEMNINVNAISARTNKNKQVIINLDLEINNINQLDKVMKQFKKLPDVLDVHRMNT